MADSQAFRPNWTSAPGDTITDILSERRLSVAEFADRIGQEKEYAKDLLEGRAPITIAVARQLERILGGSVKFWISRDFQYREDLARLTPSDAEWLDELPIGDMVNFSWLNPPPQPSDRLKACLQFFGVPSVAAWRQTYASVFDTVAFRMSPSFGSRLAAVTAWLRKGEIDSRAIECSLWNPAQFREVLPDIRPLTRQKNPKHFMPELQKLCAAAGVATVVVRAPSGCPASGATRFLSAQKALLLLSFRHLSDDQFWFSFFHEAGHLLLHGDRLFLEGAGASKTKEEREANDFAARILVPPKLEKAMLSLPLNGREVIRFAHNLGISAGIVVGQLQHHGTITHRQLNSLKRRFTWDK